MGQKKKNIEDWLVFKPYKTPAITDAYYIEFAKEVKELLLETDLDELDIWGLNGLDLLSYFLASYLEDKVSETNIWNTFSKVHFKKYKKWLPFYETEQYDPLGINKEDIAFLLWYFINSIQEEELYSPFSKLPAIAEILYEELFEEAFPVAPMNRHLRSHYHIDNKETDFYVARQLIDNILFGSYLFSVDFATLFAEKEKEIFSGKKDKIMIMALLKETRISILLTRPSRLLNLLGKDWVAEILGEQNSIANDFRNISTKITGHFFYKGQDEENIFLEHVATEKDFLLTKKSFEFGDQLSDENIHVFGLTRWKDKWWFSGNHFEVEYDSEQIQETKNSYEELKQVNLLEFPHNKKLFEENIERQRKVFLAMNNNSPIVFLPSSEIETFHERFINFYNESLQLSKKEKANLQKYYEDHYGKQNFESKNIPFDDDDDDEKTGLLFFGELGNTEIATGINSAFPLDINPYYYEEKSEKHTRMLLSSAFHTADLTRYCLENCKDKLPLFKIERWEKYLNDIEFLLAFWKPEKYKAEPTMVFV